MRDRVVEVGLVGVAQDLLGDGHADPGAAGLAGERGDALEEDGRRSGDVEPGQKSASGVNFSNGQVVSGEGGFINERF